MSLNYWQEEIIENSVAIHVLDGQMLTANETVAALLPIVSANTTAISTLNDNVEINANNISANTTAISTNTSAIATNTLALADITQYLTVTATANVFTFDLSQRKNFAITPADAVAKTFAFSNVPATSGLVISVSVFITYTNAAAITHPAGTIWKDATPPAMIAGKRYILLYTSYDAGTTWLASAIGAW